MEKSIEELNLLHKQEIAHLTMSHQAKLLEFEHQIQKQRERTLSLLEEKDKEIGLMKSTFLSSMIKKVFLTSFQIHSKVFIFYMMLFNYCLHFDLKNNIYLIIKHVY